jgi:hypothetical protein
MPPKKGSHQSDEHKKHLKASLIGRKMPPQTEIHRRHLSESKKGKIHSFLGKTHTPATIEKLRNRNKGVTNPNWKGGTSSLAESLRGCSAMTEWRKKVFTRDNYCDWFSGCKGNENLEAHHIVPFKILIKKYKIKTFEDAMNCPNFWDVNNGVSMFRSSHRAFHQMYG